MAGSMIYKLGVYLIMIGFIIGFIITAITAILERNWKNAVVAILFTVANGVIFLW